MFLQKKKKQILNNGGGVWIISVLLQDLFIFSSVSFSVSSLRCSSYLSGSAFVMSMRGSVTMGKLVGLAWATGSSSGVSDLTLSLSFSACRHDNGGSCRLPENLLWTIHSSTPRVLPELRDASLLSWGYKEVHKKITSQEFWICQSSLEQTGQWCCGRKKLQ